LYATSRIRYEQSLAPDEVQAVIGRLEASLDLPGDVVECGCFLCGTTIPMARLLQKRQPAKRIYACDTFSGFDPAEIGREQRAGDATKRHSFTDNDLVYVRRKLQRLGVADQVVLVQGLFQATLQTLPGPFCFAFIDCDLHDSMLHAARTVWPRLSPGGGCVFDDYDNDEYRGATRAIDTFIAERKQDIRDHGRLLRKLYYAVKA
jgi:O-methyltransferase